MEEIIRKGTTLWLNMNTNLIRKFWKESKEAEIRTNDYYLSDGMLKLHIEYFIHYTHKNIKMNSL